jgi:multiple antibiotic resistance protein
MNFSLIQITSAFMVLFAIIDILGSIPIILNIKKKSKAVHPLKASTIASLILIAFLFMGEGVLKLFNVDIQSFAVAGALVIFIFALEMLLDIEIFRNKGPEGSSSIVPLAFPLIAGPGSFTTLLSLRAEYATENILIALILNMIFVFFVIRSTAKIEKIIGEGGIYVLRKFFGIILLAISVKLFTTNIGFLLAQ